MDFDARDQGIKALLGLLDRVGIDTRLRLTTLVEVGLSLVRSDER